jgi:diacylglycerol O-acyltransferase-1
MCMYVAFPTLCYQTSYPRTTTIRRWWLARNVLELITGCTVLWVSVPTFLVPIVPEAARAMLDWNVLYTVELVLTMAVPSIFCWLTFFYVFFDVYLNMIAELAYFGDRNFYDDWWTSPDIGTFWGKWNKPVHNFLKTQVFVPLRFRAGMNKLAVVAFVFFVSAVAHELVVSVPLCTFSVWKLHSFYGMMAQFPFGKRKLYFCHLCEFMVCI